jgi:hypothetical protein
MRYITVARQYGIPVSLEILQFFRATLLYDSIVTRLDPQIDFKAGWKAYARRAAKDARRRVLKRARKRIGGPTRMDYLRLEQLGDAANQFAFRLQRNMEEPIIHFRNMVGKIAYAFSILLRLGAVTVVLLGSAYVADYVAWRWFHQEISWPSVLDRITSSLWLSGAVAAMALLLIRRVLIRVNEPDQKPQGGDR